MFISFLFHSRVTSDIFALNVFHRLSESIVPSRIIVTYLVPLFNKYIHFGVLSYHSLKMLSAYTTVPATLTGEQNKILK